MSTTLRGYGLILRARWRWVAWGVILATAATAVLLILWPPLYRTTATVFVRTPGDISHSMDGGDLYAQTRAETYAALAKSPGTAARVIADLGLDLSPAKLSQRIQARHIVQTALFQVKVSAPSAEEARRTAEVLLNELSAEVLTLETVPGGLLPRAELLVVDPPQLGTRVMAFGAPLYRVVIGAMVAGAFFGALGAVLGPGRGSQHRAPGGAHGSVETHGKNELEAL
ncbi:MAG: cell shape-determining protein [Mycobacterium sp.]|nr:cell shape-determining protein [Mycobacterium sp.]